MLAASQHAWHLSRVWRQATMQKIATALVLGSALLPMAAKATVTASGTNGFTIRHEAVLPVETPRAYELFLQIHSWWDRDHTYTGDALNLTITPQVGGCWCERLPLDGNVEHMRVTMVSPGSMIRFSGGLGPLAAMGAQGAMTWTFIPMADGLSRVRLDYAVTGFAAGDAGLGAMAAPVDRVLGAAIENLADYTRNLQATIEGQASPAD
jgi:hypothetical protein